MRVPALRRRRPSVRPFASRPWLARSEDGATAVEYALLVALIAGAILLGAQALGVNVGALLGDTGDTVTDPATHPGQGRGAGAGGGRGSGKGDQNH